MLSQSEFVDLSDLELAREILVLIGRLNPPHAARDARLLKILEERLQVTSTSRSFLSEDSRRQARNWLRWLRTIDPVERLTGAMADITNAIERTTSPRTEGNAERVSIANSTRHQVPEPLWLHPALLETDPKLNQLLINVGKMLGTAPVVDIRGDGREVVSMRFPFVDLDDIPDNARIALADLRFLLHGPPGSGKTEFVRDLCGRCGIPLRVVDYAELSASYIGDTEKNLAALFKDARLYKYGILMDECDSILTARSKAERLWEKTQTSQMLTLLDQHSMPVFLTTNFADQLDGALTRRISLAIEFRYLQSEGVLEAFRSLLGVEPPDWITELEFLTPGNFVALARRARLLGIEDNAPELAKALTKMNDHARFLETGRATQAIGFRTSAKIR